MIIYKYLPFSSGLKTIKNNSVLLRSPCEYNDPFDGIFYADSKEKYDAFNLFMNFKSFEMSYKELLCHKKSDSQDSDSWELLKNRIKKVGEEIKKTHVYEEQPIISFFYNMYLEKEHKSEKQLRMKFGSIIDASFDKIRKSTLASCFASSYDSMLMWSHYADEHKGVCIEYEIEDNNFKKVNYSEKIPICEITKMLKIIFGHEFSNANIDVENKDYYFALNPLLTKGKDWEYEGEVRCLFSRKKRNKHIHRAKNEQGKWIKVLDMPPANRVFVGCRISKKNERELKKVIGNTPMIKMNMSKTEYKVFPSSK